MLLLRLLFQLESLTSKVGGTEPKEYRKSNCTMHDLQETYMFINTLILRSKSEHAIMFDKVKFIFISLQTKALVRIRFVKRWVSYGFASQQTDRRMCVVRLLVNRNDSKPICVWVVRKGRGQ
jgi:hypothetical protein